MLKNALSALLFTSFLPLLLGITLPRSVIAQELIIGIEPFPPIFYENGGGLGINLFNAIQRNSDLTFEFNRMTYARAKKELKKNHLDIIGLIPKGLESKEFYQYALELDWSFNNDVDIYSLDKKYLSIENIPKASIGTLLGNADFFAEVLNIPREKFFEVSSLKHLVQMLKRQRLYAIVFERVSTMSTIKTHLSNTVYYRFLENIPATFAVQNTEQGRKLKVTLDSYMRQQVTNNTFKRDNYYHNLPSEGQISVKP